MLSDILNKAMPEYRITVLPYPGAVGRTIHAAEAHVLPHQRADQFAIAAKPTDVHNVSMWLPFREVAGGTGNVQRS